MAWWVLSFIIMIVFLGRAGRGAAKLVIDQHRRRKSTPPPRPPDHPSQSPHLQRL